MKIDKQDVLSAAKQGLISEQQASELWQFWQNKEETTPQFSFSHVLYYFGGMLSIMAVTVFVTMAWERWSGWPLFCISIVLFLTGLLFARYFDSKKLVIPAGILTTFSLAVVPLAAYNLQVAFGYDFSAYQYRDYHRIIDWHWVSIEWATLLAGIIMLYVYRYPFLMFIVAVTLWYLSMDLWPFIIQSTHFSFEDRAIFSMYFGLGIILATIFYDFKYQSENNYLFWLYIVGAITFWGGLSCQFSDSELSKFFYFLINLTMIVASVILNRRVFAVLGAMGAFGYIGHLAYTLFAGSLLFPFVLIALGFLIIFAGVKWRVIKTKLITELAPHLPKQITNRW